MVTGKRSFNRFGSHYYGFMDEFLQTADGNVGCVLGTRLYMMHEDTVFSLLFHGWRLRGFDLVWTGRQAGYLL